MDEVERRLGPRFGKQSLGIGWTPDRWRLEMWTPNCGLTMRPVHAPGVHTWEQVVELARRWVEEAGDPVISVSLVAVEPLGEVLGEATDALPD
jgi:hypothetical protein